MKIIDKKEFIKMALDKNIEAFVIYVKSFSHTLILIHLAQKAQIPLLVIEKIQILSEYSDFSNVFLKKKALILPVATDLN